MDRDYHYYGTLLAAAYAGFKAADARTIATSAQFIDDCTENLTHTAGIFSVGSRARQFNVDMGNGVVYPFFPLITSVYSVTTWAPTSNYDETRQIWMPFHFLPGNYPDQHSTLVGLRGEVSAQEALNKDSPESLQLLCRPRSDSAQNMINFARKVYAKIKSTDPELALMLVGCVMHVFADTYAHQDFAGTASTLLNGVKNRRTANPGTFTIYGHWHGCDWKPDERTFRNIQWPLNVASTDWLNVFPPPGPKTSALGHGQMGHMPDCSTIAYCYQPEWSDKPLQRNNPQQYMDAFIDMSLALSCIRDNVPFDWNNDRLRTDHVSKLKLDSAFPKLRQLICPDAKSDTEIRLYECGLCIPASDWFLKSESRWSKVAARLLKEKDDEADPVPGYDEAKFDWPQQVLRWQNEAVPLKDFKASKFFKWSIAAKLLFRANYGQLRGLGGGVGRIVRNAQLSSAMDPRQAVIDEYSRYWHPEDSASAALNEALAAARSSDEMDSILLNTYSNAAAPVTTTPDWVLLDANGSYFSFSSSSSLSIGAIRESFTPTVAQERARAQPITLMPVNGKTDFFYLRTFENRVGEYLFLEYSVGKLLNALWFNIKSDQNSMHWRKRTCQDAPDQFSFESAAKEGCFLGFENGAVKVVNQPVYWRVSPYRLQPVIDVPAEMQQV